ncbi:MAG: WecB/TagA/CpsF family glycosyltransferase [Pseudomonadota bacterium]
MQPRFHLDAGPAQITITHRNQTELFTEIGARFADGRGFALATVNLDHLVKLRESEAFRRAYGAHDLVVADGNPIVWMSRLARRPVGLVPGSDLLIPLVRLAAQAGVPVALVGATDQVLEKASAFLENEIPGVQIVARHAPAQGFEANGAEAGKILDALAGTPARLILLALGAPRQEMFAARGSATLPGVGFASFGAGLDFLAGHQHRAPRWVRRLAMEWLWRMLGNPRRLAMRYLKCALLLPGLSLRALALRGKS